MKRQRSIILGITGSIAAYKACDIVSLLTKKGHSVIVLLTKEAQEFVTPLTLQTLSRNKVITDMFALPETWSPVHTSLADAADIILIAPATAHAIGKLAHGLCDDIISCVVLAARAPVVIAPAMNEVMYQQPAVQENVALLKKRGYIFVGPVKGRLACGHEAIGHIAEPAAIVSEVSRRLR